MRRALGVAIGLLAVAIFLPPVGVNRAATDTLIVFDITQSMNVRDTERAGVPVSRLAFARASVRAALRDLPCGSRIGWGVFAEYRTLVLLAPIEVCANYADLLAALDRIDGRMRWGNASEITKGVFWALRGARDVGGRTNVLFLTDGQEAPPLDEPGLSLFSDLTAGAIGGSLLGVGGDTPQPIPRADDDDRLVGYWTADDVMQRTVEPGSAPSHEELSSVHETHLEALARKVGLRYSRLTGSDSIRRAIRAAWPAEPRRVPTEINWIAGSAALLVLLGALRGGNANRQARMTSRVSG